FATRAAWLFAWDQVSHFLMTMVYVSKSKSGFEVSRKRSTHAATQKLFHPQPAIVPGAERMLPSRGDGVHCPRAAADLYDLCRIGGRTRISRWNRWHGTLQRSSWRGDRQRRERLCGRPGQSHDPEDHPGGGCDDHGWHG